MKDLPKTGAGFEPTTLQTKRVEPTNEPPRLVYHNLLMKNLLIIPATSPKQPAGTLSWRFLYAVLSVLRGVVRVCFVVTENSKMLYNAEKVIIYKLSGHGIAIHFKQIQGVSWQIHYPPRKNVQPHYGSW